MAKISQEEIIGCFAEQQLFCTNCTSKEVAENAILDDLLLRDAAEKQDRLFFCDGCKKQIV